MVTNNIAEVEIEILWGTDIYSAYNTAKELAVFANAPVKFKFNGRVINVKVNSTQEEALATYFHRGS